MTGPMSRAHEVTTTERVRLRAHGTANKWAHGQIVLMSENGEAIGVVLEEPLAMRCGGIHRGHVPLSWSRDLDGWVDVFTGEQLDIEIWELRATAH